MFAYQYMRYVPQSGGPVLTSKKLEDCGELIGRAMGFNEVIAMAANTNTSPKDIEVYALRSVAESANDLLSAAQEELDGHIRMIKDFEQFWGLPFDQMHEAFKGAFDAAEDEVRKDKLRVCLAGAGVDLARAEA